MNPDRLVLSIVWHKADVIVLGCGPAAVAASLTLAQRGLSTLLVRRTPRKIVSVGEHLAPEAKATLSRLGLSAAMDDAFHMPSHGVVSFWGSGQINERNYISNPYGRGWNLDRTVFDKVLLQAARRRGCEVVTASRIQNAAKRCGRWHVTINTAEGPRIVKSYFLLDATGRRATLCRILGYRPQRLDRLVGLYARLPQHAVSHKDNDTRLYIEPLEDGWWYSLLLRDRSLVAVYMTDADFIPAGIDCLKDRWLNRLESSRATRTRIASPGTFGAFQVAPAQSQISVPSSGDDWLAVGAAAMAFDPLSGGGISNALEDGCNCGDSVAQWLDGNKKPLNQLVRDRESKFDAYRATRAAYYEAEVRWKQSLFWVRRTQRLN